MATIDTIFKITASVVGGNAVKELSKSIKDVSTGGENMRRTLTQGAVAMKTFAGAIATREIVNFFRAAIDLGDQINDISQKTGVSAQALGKFKAAAEASGTTLEAVAGSLNKLNKNIVDARDKTGPAASAFAAMGISIKDANGNIKSAEIVTKEIADRFAAFPDGPQKAALAMAIFGKSGTDMIPMLNMGSEAIDKFKLNISDSFKEGADAFNDKIGAMKTSVQQFAIDVTEQMLPALNDMIDAMSAVFSTGEGASNFGMVMSDSFRLITVMAAALVEGLKQVWSGLLLIGDSINALGKSATFDFSGAFTDANSAIDRYKQRFSGSQNRFDKIADKNVSSSYTFGDGGEAQKGLTKKNSLDQKTFNGMSGYDPGGASKAASDAEKLNEALNKKLLLLQADTDSIGLNNSEKEKARVLAEFEAKGLEKTSEGYKQLSDALDENTKSHRSFAAGAKEAFAEYADAASNAAEQTKNFITNSLKGMEDAMVDFVTTGKMNFKDLANSIIKDLARILVQRSITGPLSDAIGGMFGGGGSSGGGFFSTIKGFFGFADGGIMSSSGTLPLKKYAAGGIASSPQMAMFGEGSMNEAYVPLPDGRSIPVTMKGGGGTTNVSVTVNMDQGGGQTDAKGDSRQGVALGNMIASTVKSMLINEKLPGGLLAT